MSKDYDIYIAQHRSFVSKAYIWIKENLPEYYDALELSNMENIIKNHDKSKFDKEEYDAYDEYFYGSGSNNEEFNKAWLHHIHNNPHHWQHWVLINDDMNEGIVALDMPDVYIFEMICDWWSFSWKSGNLYEIFDWYDSHKDYIVLSESTRYKVESCLSIIKRELDN